MSPAVLCTKIIKTSVFFDDISIRKENSHKITLDEDRASRTQTMKVSSKVTPAKITYKSVEGRGNFGSASLQECTGCDQAREEEGIPMRAEHRPGHG